MHFPLVLRSMILAAFAAWLVFPPGVLGQATTPKPPLSAEIATVIAKDGVEAGQRRFDELYPAQKDNYDLDIRGFFELGAKYMQSGNTAAGQQVLAMATTIAQAGVAMPTGAGTPDQRPPARAESKPERPSGDLLGAQREDLARFTGLYGDPNRTEKTRTLWVSTTCNGHLVAGASWGDASPWYMRSRSDTAFEAEIFGGNVLQFEFQIGADGTAQAMLHGLDYLPNPVPRVGPLPKEWQECIQPPEIGG